MDIQTIVISVLAVFNIVAIAVIIGGFDVVDDMQPHIKKRLRKEASARRISVELLLEQILEGHCYGRN